MAKYNVGDEFIDMVGFRQRIVEVYPRQSTEPQFYRAVDVAFAAHKGSRVQEENIDKLRTLWGSRWEKKI